MGEGSKIFTPYRAVGLVSTAVPLVTRYIHRRKEHLIVTTVGSTFHTYGAAKLGLLSVGNPHTRPIQALAADAYHVYTSCGGQVYAWRRGTELKHKYGDEAQADVHIMLPFGPHLIVVDQQNVMRLWDIKMESLYMEMEFPRASFEITALMHPATYLNKILLGSEQGKMQLWNLNTCKLVFTFSGWDSAVQVLVQAPAPDVVAVGLSNGKIILHNLKFDETVVEFHQDWGKVTGISFRTDGFPVMVTGSEVGHIAVWDLKERRLQAQVLDAHGGPVTGLQCLSSEPLMVTSSPDNTLKMWIFDLPDGGARLLKHREGHSAPPLSVRFHGSLGDFILSAGEDSRMRLSSTVKDEINKSLGQAVYKKKANRTKGTAKPRVMPPITRFTSETTQEKAWDNLAAVHQGKTIVTTWSIGSQRMGDHRLMHERFKDGSLKGSLATCLDMSVCGNFVVVGYNSGHMDKFNLQSGIHRGSYGAPLAHAGGVMDLVTDGLNQYVVSAGQDDILKWWKMKTCSELKQLRMDESISRMHLHKDSGLLAVCLEDWSIHIVDVDTKNVVRKLFGHHNQVTDVAFSPDSRWLLTASLDKTIRTWDMPSGCCVDSFLVPVPCSALTMSPVGDLLATIHSDHLGIYLWSNQACYHQLSLRPLPQDHQASTIALPSTGAPSSQVVAKEGETVVEPEVVESEVDDDEYKSPEQISEELITLALLPTSRWLNLLNLDVIKKRNKPKEPPKVPKSAPFFLPTIPGLEFKFAPSEDKKKDEVSRVRAVKSFEVLTPFGKKLKDGQLEEALKMLLAMGVSGIEVEVQGLDPDTGGSEEVMAKFLEMIKFALEKQCYYEAVQGYLGLFLKHHAESVMNNRHIYEICEQLAVSQGDSWHKLCNTMNQTLCLVSYFKNAALINY